MHKLLRSIIVLCAATGACALLLGIFSPTLAQAGWRAAWLGNAQVQNQIHYVAPGGSCGSVTPCYTTIQSAVYQAAAGNEIRIAAGVYTGVNNQGGLSQVVYLAKSLT